MGALGQSSNRELGVPITSQTDQRVFNKINTHHLLTIYIDHLLGTSAQRGKQTNDWLFRPQIINAVEQAKSNKCAALKD